MKVFAFAIAIVTVAVSLFGTSRAAAESVYTIRDSAAYYMNLGNAELASRKYANAWRYFEEAARLDNRNADAQLGIAEVCMKMNRMAPAIKALESASALRPDDYDTQWRLVQMYYNFGQHDKVIALLPTLHSKVTNLKGWAYMLGKSHYSLQNFGKALEYLQISLKEEPADAEAAYHIGRIYVQMDNYKAATPYYKRSLAIDSTSQVSRTYEYALVLAAAGQFDASVKAFEKAIVRGYKPRDDFYINMAYTMADAKKSDEAIKMLQDILSRRPEDLGLLNGLADVCYHSGRHKQAIAYWNKVLTIDENNAHVIYRIGMAYIKMGNEKDGKLLCDRAIQMDPALGVLRHEKQMSF